MSLNGSSGFIFILFFHLTKVFCENKMHIELMLAFVLVVIFASSPFYFLINNSVFTMKKMYKCIYLYANKERMFNIKLFKNFVLFYFNQTSFSTHHCSIIIPRINWLLFFFFQFSISSFLFSFFSNYLHFFTYF